MISNYSFEAQVIYSQPANLENKHVGSLLQTIISIGL